MIGILTLIEFLLYRRRRRTVMRTRFDFGEFSISGVGPMDLIVSEGMKVRATLAPKDKNGNPAKIDGVPVWEEDSDLGNINMIVAEDGMSATFEIGNFDEDETVTVTVTADIDLGDDIEEFEEVHTLTVVADKATDLGFSWVLVEDEKPEDTAPGAAA